MPLPKTLFVHGYVNLSGTKMSKSLGTVIDPFEQIEKYGVEADISYISTGGGAFLEFVEGRTLPAVAALERRAAA